MPQAVHRTPRMRPAGPDRTQFDLPALPALDPVAKLQPVQLLLPVLGSLSILVYGLMARTAILLVTGGIMALASLASPIVLYWSARRSQQAKLARRRVRYGEQLAVLDAAAAAARARLASVLGEAHPTPGEYTDWAASSRLWERRLEDDDVLAVRLGTADIPSGLTINRPSSGTADTEPDTELAAPVDAFAATAGVLPAAPLCLDLADTGVLTVAGIRSGARRLVRAVVLELALTCAPDDVALVIAVPPGTLDAWDWAKWLPHTASSSARAADRRLATTAEEVERHLDELVTPRLRLLEEGTWAASREVLPRVLVVVDRFDPFSEIGVSPALTRTLERGLEVGVSVVALVDEARAAPTQARALVTVGPDGVAELRRFRQAASPLAFAPAEVRVEDAEKLARFLAPKRLVADSVRSARTTSGRLAALLPSGLLAGPLAGPWPDGPDSRSGSEEAFRWPRPEPRDLLRVPFAVSADGATLRLDLKESAEGGCGPHGLVVGAVGSGKSELLRTVVAALAATHGPEDVELAFADFKGGLTFSLLHGVPHCSGMITNLVDDLSLVDRMKAALLGELERRQQLLRAAGDDVQKIGQYRALRERHPELPPMPFLVVVVDEFGELLDARPDVLDVLLSIGRTGRSLGVHLVLASQRLELGRVRGLDSYLGYRICLRTFTAEDSMAVLGTRAAADLPALPGHGYLRTADGVVRFLTATVSGRSTSADAPRAVAPFAPASGVRARHSESEPLIVSDRESDLAVLVRRANAYGAGRERPRLWLPPLPGPVDAGRLTLWDERLQGDAPPAAVGLPVPLGLVDLPRSRSQVPLRLDPAALDGHVLVVGAPRSGKSTVLAAYAIQAAHVHPAPLLQFHVLDLGGGALAPLAELPNVASYVDGQDPDGVRRVILELERIVENRPRPSPPGGRERTRGVARHGVVGRGGGTRAHRAPARPAHLVPGPVPGPRRRPGPPRRGRAQRRRPPGDDQHALGGASGQAARAGVDAHRAAPQRPDGIPARPRPGGGGSAGRAGPWTGRRRLASCRSPAPTGPRSVAARLPTCAPASTSPPGGRGTMARRDRDAAASAGGPHAPRTGPGLAPRGRRSPEAQRRARAAARRRRGGLPAGDRRSRRAWRCSRTGTPVRDAAASSPGS